MCMLYALHNIFRCIDGSNYNCRTYNYDHFERYLDKFSIFMLKHLTKAKKLNLKDDRLKKKYDFLNTGAMNRTMNVFKICKNVR